MSLINELEKLVAKASDKAADLEVYARDMSLLPAGYADAVVGQKQQKKFLQS